jgi:hypothetical protein
MWEYLLPTRSVHAMNLPKGHMKRLMVVATLSLLSACTSDQSVRGQDVYLLPDRRIKVGDVSTFDPQSALRLLGTADTTQVNLFACQATDYQTVKRILDKIEDAGYAYGFGLIDPKDPICAGYGR